MIIYSLCINKYASSIESFYVLYYIYVQYEHT